MSFVHGAWLWLLPVLLPALVLLHARRRRDVVVPNLLIWRRVAADGLNAPSVRSVPWRDPLLWLQALALTFVVLALARPVVGYGSGPTDWVVLVDTSVAMSSRDVSPDRLSAAISDIEARFARKDTEATVSVVRAGAPATVLAARWPAGPGLTRVTSAITAGEAREDWRGAAIRAELLAGEDGRVVVYTDGQGVEAARSALTEVGLADRASYLTLGGDLVNVGIRDVHATVRGDRPDRWDVSGTVTTSGLERGDVIRVMASYRSTGTDTFLPWGGTDVVLAADGTAEFEMPLDLPGPGDLRLDGPTGDQAPADDSVVVPLRPEPVRVVVVGEAPPALLRALAAVGDLEVYAAPAVPAPQQARLFDLAIVTDDLPGVPQTSTLWLGAVPEAVRDGEAVELAGRPLSAGAHDLVRDLEPGVLVAGRAQPVVALEGATPLLSSGDKVLAWARTTTVGRQIVVGVDPVSSAWQSQLSFPAFVAEVVAWAAPRAWSHQPSGCRTSRSCPWPREAFAGDWVLVSPAGDEIAAPVLPRAVPSDPLADAVWDQDWFDDGFRPELSGVYRLRSPRGDVQLPVVSAPVEAGRPSGDVPAAAPPPTALPAWRWAAVVALLLIFVEAGLAVARKEAALTRSRRQGAFLLAAVALLGSGVLGVRVPVARSGGSATWVGPASSDTAFARVRTENPGRTWSRIAVVEGPNVTQGRGPGDDLSTPDAALALEVALAMPPAPGDDAVIVELDPSMPVEVGSASNLWRRTRAVTTSLHVVETDVPPALQRAGDRLSVTAVTWPERVRSGAQFSVDIRVEAPTETGWTARLEPTAPGEEAAGDRIVGVEVRGSGPSSASLELTAGPPGDPTYRLTLTPLGAADPTYDGLITVAVGPPVSALLVAADEHQGSALEAALRTQRVDVTRTTPFRMPGEAEDLAVYDAVLLVNVSANELFPEYQAALEAYVREWGGGLTIFGGPSAFGPGGYYTTPLESVSPLSARISEDAPEVSITFVLDRSGSMSGPVGDATRMDVAKAATVEALALLGEQSLAAIVVFDTSAQVVLPFTPVVEAQVFRDALAGVGAAGGTAIYPGLVAAFGLLSENESATRHVVVMTDGLSQEGDFEGVLTALGEMGVSVSFVGVGDGADGRQLNKLAGLSGGSLHMARDFRSLPGLLAQEALMLAAEPIEERTTSASWVDAEGSGFLEDVAGNAPPALRGYVRTTAKDEASVHLVEQEHGDPLIASWRYGLGRVVAFASAADGPWSEEWEGTDFYGRLWAQALRWTAERPIRDVWSVRTEGGSGYLQVLVDVPLEMDGLDLPLVELSADGKVVNRSQLTPRGAGSAVARFAVSDDWEGTLAVTVLPVPEQGLSQPVVRAVNWPLPPSEHSQSRGVALADLAVATGGSVGVAVDLPAVTPHLVWGGSPAAWFVLALLSFITALALRYGAIVVLFGSIRAARRARTRTASLAR